MPRSMDLRAAFPVLDRFAYLNAGTDGPVPLPAIDAANARLSEELRLGRSGERHWEGLRALHDRRRTALAELLHCQPGEVALTRSTTDGANAVLSGLDLRQGDEVVTSDQEHPGLLAPLAAARLRKGIEVTVAPFESIAEAVTPGRTRLVACSHVSWVNGSVVDTAALRETGVSVLLDGAQGLGAVPIDVGELGCDYYAASGQKWLCGPDGTGCLYVNAERIDELAPPWLGFQSLDDPHDPLGLHLHPDARRFDLGFLTGHSAAWSLASIELLANARWDEVHSRAAGLAARLADSLRERGLEVEPRGDTTLVAWRDPDPEARVKVMAENGVIVRQIPDAGVMRASVGAWSNEDDLERLLALVR
jgi:selenocysteine lyase/cysteine desulfurase